MNLDYASGMAINTCIGLKSHETVMIIYDKTTKRIAASLKDKVKAKDAGLIEVDLDRLRPDPTPPDLEGMNICIFMADSLAGELESLRRPLRLKALEKKVRYVHMPKITEEIFIDSVGVDYHKIWDLTKRLYDVLKDVSRIRLRSRQGTDLDARFSSEIRWVRSDGDFRNFDSQKLNLPGAEILTCPENIEGMLVVDGLLGGHFTKKFGVLEKKPIRIQLVGSRAKEIRCNDEKLLHEFIDHVRTDENSDKIGEFAFGTNIFLKKYYYNFLVDEKHPGFHVAFGNPYPERTGALWKSSIHLDCLIKDADATTQNKRILTADRFMI